MLTVFILKSDYKYKVCTNKLQHRNAIVAILLRIYRGLQLWYELGPNTLYGHLLAVCAGRPDHTIIDLAGEPEGVERLSEAVRLRSNVHKH